jgi:hypothetical protein
MENKIQGERNFEYEPFYYDELVDVINREDGVVVDAQIISMRGNILVVRYTHSKEEQIIHLEDNLILKRCII